MTEQEIADALIRALKPKPSEDSWIFRRIKEWTEKQVEKLTPPGKPLKPWGKEPVPISEEDIDLAIAEWNERVPEAAGLLEAE